LCAEPNIFYGATIFINLKILNNRHWKRTTWTNWSIAGGAKGLAKLESGSPFLQPQPRSGK